jgi:hypothetical protein
MVRVLVLSGKGKGEEKENRVGGNFLFEVRGSWVHGPLWPSVRVGAERQLAASCAQAGMQLSWLTSGRC